MNGQRILVIDDDAAVRLMATAALEDAGYAVVDAGSAEEGLALFEAAPTDLVLLDVVLPGINGYAACARLRALPAGRDVPVIVMTGLDDRSSILEAYESGATDFITKPIVWDLLPFRARYALRSSGALQDTRRSGALLARSQQLAQMGSWEWDCASGRVECSAEMHRIHGTTATARGEAGMATLLAGVHGDDLGQLQQMLAFAQTEGQPYELELRVVRPDGGTRRVFEQTDVERDSAGHVVAVRGIRRDITQQVEAERRIRTLAYFDTLTGLANRSLFNEMAAQWLPYAERRQLRCAVIYIDIDRFKLINETLGPRIGDDVLKLIGERLRDCVRASDLKASLRSGDADASAGHGPSAERSDQGDLLARLGGDEFTLLLVDMAEPEAAAAVARRIMRTLAEPLRVAGQDLTLTASIGIACTPDDGMELDALLRNASTAMHAAKAAGRNEVRFYLESMSTDIQRRLTLENDLRRALEQGELSVHYQAKVDARTSAIVGAEALLRWRHPQRGNISPVEFIPVAEESGLIVPITDWVIHSVCRQLAAWRAGGTKVVPVSVNLDGKSMQNERLMDTIHAAMAVHGIGPAELEFEVTESGLMRDLDRASEVLTALKALGLTLSIDDFGTGYSSLTYLKRFPVDVLKIDRSFVTDLMTDANDAALTAAIIAMGLSLNLALVAEGVETWAQADFLTRRGCHLVQGYLFARPLPCDEFAELLHHGAPQRLNAPALAMP